MIDWYKKRYVGGKIKSAFVIIIIFAVTFMFFFAHFQEQGRSYGGYRYGHVNTLKRLGITMAMYSSDMYFGTMPNNLNDLEEIQHEDVNIYISKIYRRGSINRGWRVNQLHYLYEGGADPDDISPSAPVVVFPYANSRGVSYCVLFHDTHVKIFRNLNDAFITDGGN